MTVVTTGPGAEAQLICDECAKTTVVDGCGLRDADVVYVAAAGWSGPGFARGPHRCPTCSTIVHRPTPATETDQPVRVRLTVEHAYAVVRVTGDLDADAAAELETVLAGAVHARRQIVVDLSAAKKADAAGLAALVRARNMARRRHGEVLLARPSRYVQIVLRTARLHRAFRVFGTVQQAVTAAGGPVTAAVRPVAAGGPVSSAVRPVAAGGPVSSAVRSGTAAGGPVAPARRRPGAGTRP
ncbi:STAS domain-containing protein [Actinoplanes sp. DH11]|uniref:STAS domain-containing protein n=1 Tax=Actinoplanes sp. DH11 TaxID=2857011 RepID=UPI001E48ABF9|nr:STAS domain-containing protein [Actinoplanes sp. DH11]